MDDRSTAQRDARESRALHEQRVHPAPAARFEQHVLAAPVSRSKIGGDKAVVGATGGEIRVAGKVRKRASRRVQSVSACQRARAATARAPRAAGSPGRTRTVDVAA